MFAMDRAFNANGRKRMAQNTKCEDRMSKRTEERRNVMTNSYMSYRGMKANGGWLAKIDRICVRARKVEYTCDANDRYPTDGNTHVYRPYFEKQTKYNKTDHKTHFISGANCCMFRHQESLVVDKLPDDGTLVPKHVGVAT